MTSEPNFSFRRTQPRFLFSADADATLPDGTLLPAQVFELSSRGCYIDLIKALPVGTSLRLRISHGPSQCEVLAKVIYLQPGFGMAVYGMGVVFENMTDEQRSTIEAWVAELAREDGVSSISQTSQAS